MSNGTYAGLRIKEARTIHRWAEEFVPNVIKPEDMHVTLLYSRKELPHYEPNSELSFSAYMKELNVWNTEDGNTLVVLLDSPHLMIRHDKLMKEHGATWDYPSYEPHFTLSYDVGDMKIPTANFSETQPITLLDEYKEELQDI